MLSFLCSNAQTNFVLHFCCRFHLVYNCSNFRLSLKKIKVHSDECTFISFYMYDYLYRFHFFILIDIQYIFTSIHHFLVFVTRANNDFFVFT